MTAVEGIDLVVTGRNVPMLQRGRVIKNTVVCYGGEQGWYVGRTSLALDAAGRSISGENDMIMLGPEVEGEARRVRRREGVRGRAQRPPAPARERGAPPRPFSAEDSDGEAVDHYVGAEVCGRCHKAEYQQWLDAARARGADARGPEDARRRVRALPRGRYQRPGGFKTADDAPKLGNVQCENCHGVGTQHEGVRGAEGRSARARLPRLPRRDDQPGVPVRALPSAHPAPGAGEHAGAAAEPGEGEDEGRYALRSLGRVRFSRGPPQLHAAGFRTPGGRGDGPRRAPGGLDARVTRRLTCGLRPRVRGPARWFPGARRPLPEPTSPIARDRAALT